MVTEQRHDFALSVTETNDDLTWRASEHADVGDQSSRGIQ